MEELGRDSGCDDERRGELFICGVFSLLDRMFQLPFAELLTEISPAGVVLRELGLNGDHEVVHRAPTVTNRGMFDNQVVSLANPRTDFSVQNFERLWST
mgnify:CR=1 FL=1